MAKINLQVVDEKDRRIPEKFLLNEFARFHARIAYRLGDYGFTAELLKQLPVIDQAGIGTPLMIPTRGGVPIPWWIWSDLLDIRYMGPRRLLDLVNFVRDAGYEWPWFEKWDERSQYWAELRGCHRTPKVVTNGDNG